jgi:DNA-binding MarR family transcriptional regulator
MVLKGLVKKIPCAKDKRLVDVTITDKGQKLLKKMDTESEQMDAIMKSLTESEAEMLSNLLDKLRTAD